MGISPSDVTSLSSLKDRPSSSSLKEEKTGDPVSKQAILANEKRRRRRESHNAVERRRRDNINEKISELATLIPECMLDPTGMCLIPFFFTVGTTSVVMLLLLRCFSPAILQF